jgi:hypothetical protein
MSLSRNEVVPLSVLNLRRLTFIPEHFTKISLPICDVRKLDHWINYYLNSRYAICRTLSLDSGNKMSEVLEVGLEDPREVSILTLGCPYVHNK